MRITDRRALLIFFIGVLLSTTILTGLSHAQGPESEMSTQIMGYDQSYGLYITAPLNTSVNMINNFTLTLRSPGESTYAILLNDKQTENGTFSYETVLWFNTTWTGTDILTIRLYSSVLNVTQTFQYDLSFVTITEYVNYVSQKVAPSPKKYTQFDMEAFGYVSLIMGIILLGLWILFSYESRLAAAHKEGGIRIV